MPSSATTDGTGRSPRRRRAGLRKLALFLVLALLAVRPHLRLTARHPNDVRAAHDGSATRDAPSASTSMRGNEGRLLQPTDSLYKQYNQSTTPLVLAHYKLVFFTTEKTGSTILRQLLRRMMGYDDYRFHGNGIPHQVPQNGLKVLTNYALDEANDMLTNETWTRAMFVRDPKERALSAFLMWKPKRTFDSNVLDEAWRGMLHESVLPDGVNPLIRCCRSAAGGDVNAEALCFNHTRTFAGFLDVVEDPHDADANNVDATDGPLGGQRNDTALPWSPRRLRASPSCPDKHWSPVTDWRMETKFYPRLNFIGHLETARWDIQRLLDRLHPTAWERYGASGWGKDGNESLFASTTTLRHAGKTEERLREYFLDEGVERRVERIYRRDYENKYLDLERVPVGDAKSFYQRRYLERFGNSTLG